MSRIGKLPITLPKGTEAVLAGRRITVKGPKGELGLALPEKVKVELSGSSIAVSVADPEDKKQKSLWGLYRNLVNNMVSGVNQGFVKKLEISGVGYRAAVQGQKLTLNVGYSHPVDFLLPAGIQGAVEGNSITLSGIDKGLIGETAAQIRKVRPPEPYKGKGIKYAEETIRRKAGKTAAKGGDK